MNKKNISKALQYKLDDWLSSIDNLKVKTTIRQNAIVTGGALVSLLNNETPNDYDIYFKTLGAAETVATYYANIWNTTHPKEELVVSIDKVNNRIMVNFNTGGKALDIRGENMMSAQAALEREESGIDDLTEPELDLASENPDNPTQPNPAIKEPKYRPRYFTTNAISLSDGIQLVVRFVGPVDEIHTNYDFEHTKCSFDYGTNEVTLPNKALECIINKELVYSGSKYPLCSIIRTRKFIERGWHINAGQYVKMALQLNELDLKNIEVFKDQLVGVDSVYFNQAIMAIEKKQKSDPAFELDNAYLFEIIDRLF